MFDRASVGAPGKISGVTPTGGNPGGGGLLTNTDVRPENPLNFAFPSPLRVKQTGTDEVGTHDGAGPGQRPGS